MTKCFLDSETCGLHGMAVLLQYAYDDGPIELYSPWTEPVIDTLKLIERIMECDLIGFNLAFDHFHLCKLYTIFSQLDPHSYPEDDIDLVAKCEPLGRDGLCVKPRRACDVMLVARQGPYQSTMDRGDIRIKKVPSQIAWELQKELEERVKLDNIYFARRKDKNAPQWKVYDNSEEPEAFKDLVLKFAASSALKNLAVHALKIPPGEIMYFDQVAVDKSAYPIELGYAPFASAISSAETGWRAKKKQGQGWKNGYAWPGVIHRHISHWLHHKIARVYALKDVEYTRDLYRFFGSPEPGDMNSELACMVGAVRWKGFKLDIPAIKKLKANALIKSELAPKAPAPVLHYVTEVMDPIEKIHFEDKGTTKKTVLEKVTTWKLEDDKPHPAAIRAQEVLDARQYKSECVLFDKLLIAGRFHASFSVIGTLSSRMSGSGSGLNSQGIKRAKAIRSCFPLSSGDNILCGGDFVSFEVVLADAVYADPDLREDLTKVLPCGYCNATGVVKATQKALDDPETETIDGMMECPVCDGQKEYVKKIHALFGMHVYPDMTYEEIVADKEKYTRSKSAVFAMLYGGEAFTLQSRLGVDIEIAEKAYQAFTAQYKKVGEGRKRYNDMFCSMRQPAGIGSAVEWHEPANFIESIFGFRRYFTLENQICSALYTLANKPPKHWKQFKGTVVRREREQKVSGATMSALFAAAFALQSSNMRAAGNHVIQSSGAEITKRVQKNIWDIQPSGASAWKVQPMNIHDEVMCPTHPDSIDKINKVVRDTVESFRPQVPLIGIDWGDDLNSWADK